MAKNCFVIGIYFGFLVSDFSPLRRSRTCPKTDTPSRHAARARPQRHPIQIPIAPNTAELCLDSTGNPLVLLSQPVQPTRVFDLLSGEEHGEIRCIDSVRSWFPGGVLYCFCLNDKIEICELPSGKTRGVISDSPLSSFKWYRSHFVAMTPDCRTVLFYDGDIHVWVRGLVLVVVGDLHRMCACVVDDCRRHMRIGDLPCGCRIQ